MFWNLNNLKEKYYFSLSDVYNEKTVGSEILLTPWTFTTQTNEGIFSFIKTITGQEFPASDSDETKTLFRDYIWPRYWKEWLFVSDSEEIDEENVLEVCGRIYSWIMATKDNYAYLINTYNTERDTLLRQIQTSSSQSVADTPQVSTDEWDEESAEYLSSLSGSTTLSDGDTIINRIDEIRRKIRNIYETWAREFAKFLLW